MGHPRYIFQSFDKAEQVASHRHRNPAGVHTHGSIRIRRHTVDPVIVISSHEHEIARMSKDHTIHFVHDMRRWVSNAELDRTFGFRVYWHRPFDHVYGWGASYHRPRRLDAPIITREGVKLNMAEGRWVDPVRRPSIVKSPDDANLIWCRKIKAFRRLLQVYGRMGALDDIMKLSWRGNALRDIAEELCPLSRHNPEVSVDAVAVWIDAIERSEVRGLAAFVIYNSNARYRNLHDMFESSYARVRDDVLMRVGARIAVPRET